MWLLGVTFGIVKQHIPITSNMAKKPRVNSYTSTSIGKDKLVLLNDFQAYLKEHYNLTVSHQAINDMALERAWATKEEFGKALQEQDPELVEYRRLQAKFGALDRA